ncbi:HDL265Wp [Eremothecium sinecaudum]|uniref:Protein YOP1 n=1 Tax=Eremothecium sinecaudum TaxID=45286 RepID=A0A0X8HS70_9SACH|nr:HDL265Wp [Eremothecium sinecaudum]AMD20479.1 HDL265Wp [Eremothecium sinecaudum]
MPDFVSKARQQMSDIDKHFAGNRYLQEFERRTSLPKSYAVLGGVALYLLLVFINVGGVGEILSNFVGFVLPGYYSLKALKTANTADDTQLLTYWIVFAFLSVIEFWSKAILYWVPFYWFFKTIFLLFIALPQFGGAEIVYNTIIAPLTDPYIAPNFSKKASGISSKLGQAAKDATSGKSSGAAAKSFD